MNKPYLAVGWIAGWLALAASAAPPAMPPTPAAVEEVLVLRPFQLEEPFPYLWRQEQPKVTAGMLMVVRVDPALAYPRQVAEPVLYVGGQTAMRLNVGYPSGRIVALVPTPPDFPAGDMDIWFGTPRLPESVNTDSIALERQRARQAGIAPVPSRAAQIALSAGGPAIQARNLSALLKQAAQLVRQYAPDEGPLAESLEGQAP